MAPNPDQLTNIMNRFLDIDLEPFAFILYGLRLGG